ncbi:tigger transposable element-derived protein 1 isoform X1 [Erpetoichthys calabaricus]|uniref:tigger transposable element-derived protein 1 isoform X1 n=1 Tax=Erpetoichthys calabaricus TaxID=27687 RepID=UPI0022348120|nr:tigger transposable element-derived protein 1 isoform X1 [Erpetoichthys calabaricus]
MPSRTYISAEERIIPGFKDGKDKLTVLLGCNASGCCKLKPLIVYHSENPRTLKGISKATLPVYYRSNPKTWVTVDIFEDWFVNCFIPEVEKYCRENGIPFKILLILDNAPGHPAHLDDFHPNVKVLFLPPSTTSLVQPMEQGLTENFKAYYLRTTFAQAVAAIDRNPNLSVREFWQSYSLYHGILNIAKAWQELSPNCCVAVWKRMCPQFMRGFKGFEKDETYEGVADKIVKLAEELDLEVDKNDVEELIESHGEELTDEDLLELEAAKDAADVQAVALEEPEEKPKCFIAEEMSIAFREIASGMARLEKMDPNASRFLKVQRGVDESLACYREIYEEKKRAITLNSRISIQNVWTKSEDFELTVSEK